MGSVASLECWDASLIPNFYEAKIDGNPNKNRLSEEVKRKFR